MSRASVHHRLATLLLVMAACVLVPATAFADEATPSVPPTVSPEPTVTPLPVVRLEDDNTNLRFTGAWKSAWLYGVSGQTVMLSSRAKSYASASFEGTGAALVTRTGPDRGRARIYLDGVAIKTIDLYSAKYGSAVAWESGELADRVHTVTVEVLGTKRSASKGTKVVVDAFDITGKVSARKLTGTVVNNGNSKLYATKGWWVSKRSAAIGDSAWRTKKKGTSVTVRFRGSAITWLGRKDAASGRAAVYLDGKKVATVSQYAETTSERRVVWSISGLANTEHSLVVRAMGTKSASAGGTCIDVDSFVIGGDLLKAYGPTPFSYPWKTYIVIDKSQYRLYWVRNGMLIKVYPIAHGKSSTPTPSRVWRIDAKYHTDPRGVYGPRKMRLFKQVSTSRGYRYVYTAYGIHGTNEPWVIGTKASHGCIRMYNKDVLELWPQVPLGTMVVTRD